jgi:hypothetical protein
MVMRSLDEIGVAPSHAPPARGSQAAQPATPPGREGETVALSPERNSLCRTIAALMLT